MSDPRLNTTSRRAKPTRPARTPGPRRAVFDDSGRLVAVIEGRDVTDQDVTDCLRCLAMAPNNPSRGPIA